MFLKIILPSLKRHLAYATYFNCIPFDWNHATGNIVLNKTSRRRVSINMWIALQILYLAFQICYTFLGQNTLIDKFEAAIIILLYCSVFIHLDTEHDLTPMTNYNRLIDKLGNILIFILQVNRQNLH